MLSLLAELVVGGLVHELLKLIGVGKLQLHKPSLLHRRLVHNRGSLSEVLNISILIIDIDNDIKSHHKSKLTVLTSRTLPLAGQKASEAAFTDSTEENTSLTIIYKLDELRYLLGSNLSSDLRKLNVDNISEGVLGVVSNTDSSGLSGVVLRY